MDGSKSIIAMIEHRRRQQPWLTRLASTEPHPSKVPAFQLWRTPEYLIYLIERETLVLMTAGASQDRAVEILAEVLRVGGALHDATDLIMRLLEEHFAKSATEYRPLVDDLRAIVRTAIPEIEIFGYPPRKWLSGETTIDALNDQLRGQLDRRLLFPRSRFEEQLQHFKIMSRIGGKVFRYSSPPESWRLMIGRAGYALVHDDRSLAYVETLMN